MRYHERIPGVSSDDGTKSETTSTPPGDSRRRASAKNRARLRKWQILTAYRALRERLAPWDRPVTAAEYETVCEAVDRLGFDAGWVQDMTESTPCELVGYDMEAREMRSGQGEQS